MVHTTESLHQSILRRLINSLMLDGLQNKQQIYKNTTLLLTIFSPNLPNL